MNDQRGETMVKPRTLIAVCCASAAVVLAARSGLTATGASAEQARPAVANFISGEGLPNPTPKVIQNWGELPAGRTWGTSAGIDIDPKDGHIWAYERCAAGTAGGGPVDCENNPVDPIFKFDRHTGKVLANFGRGTMITPHGIHVDPQGNVWIADFAGNKAGTKGHQVHKFSPDGTLLMSLGQAGQPGNADGQFNQPNDVVTGPDGSIYVSDGHDGQGMTTAAAIAEGIKRARRAPRRVPHAARAGVRCQGPAVGGRPR
jgi:DNA-binding beta-propeller fold protein YncE